MSSLTGTQAQIVFEPNAQVKAMMGMLTTNPKVTITFETVLAIPTT